MPQVPKGDVVDQMVPEPKSIEFPEIPNHQVVREPAPSKENFNEPMLA